MIVFPHMALKTVCPYVRFTLFQLNNTVCDLTWFWSAKISICTTKYKEEKLIKSAWNFRWLKFDFFEWRRVLISFIFDNTFSSNANQQPSDIPESVINKFPLEKVRDRGPLLAPGMQCRICLRGYEVNQFVRKLPRCKHKVISFSY